MFEQIATILSTVACAGSLRRRFSLSREWILLSIRCDLCTVNYGNVLVHSIRVTSCESCPPSQVLCSQPQCISASSSLTGNGSKSENGFPNCFRKRSTIKAIKSWSPLRSFSPGNLLYLASGKIRQYKQLCSLSLWLPFQEFYL